jgi:glycerol kinase
VQWLRDGLGVIERAADVEALARSVPDSGGVVIVPAFAGLGAPHWRADARGLIDGLTRGTTRAHLARAALEAMALQNVDLIRAMESDLAATGAAPARLTSLRVDGGAAANDLLMQIQADLLGVEIRRPAFLELTALGAARLAARGVGLPIADLASSASGVTRFEPRLAAEHREEILARWRTVVAKT